MSRFVFFCVGSKVLGPSFVGVGGVPRVPFLSMSLFFSQTCFAMWTATVDFMKAFDSISHNSIWEALLSCNVEHGYVCLLKKITKIRRHQCRQTKRAKFSISKRLQTGRSTVQPALQHGAAVCIKKDGTEMAKNKRNGYLLERPRTRLSDELAIRRRRDAVRNIQRTDAKHDV